MLSPIEYLQKKLADYQQSLEQFGMPSDFYLRYQAKRDAIEDAIEGLKELAAEQSRQGGN